MSHTFKSLFIQDHEIGEIFARLEQSLNEAQPSLELTVLHAAPKRTRAGMLVIADGADWNPGSGEGMYRRDKTNASWVFIG